MEASYVWGCMHVNINVTTNKLYYVYSNVQDNCVYVATSLYINHYYWINTKKNCNSEEDNCICGSEDFYIS